MVTSRTESTLFNRIRHLRDLKRLGVLFVWSRILFLMWISSTRLIVQQINVCRFVVSISPVFGYCLYQSAGSCSSMNVLAGRVWEPERIVFFLLTLAWRLLSICKQECVYRITDVSSVLLKISSLKKEYVILFYKCMKSLHKQLGVSFAITNVWMVIFRTITPLGEGDDLQNLLIFVYACRDKIETWIHIRVWKNIKCKKRKLFFCWVI